MLDVPEHNKMLDVPEHTTTTATRAGREHLHLTSLAFSSATMHGPRPRRSYLVWATLFFVQFSNATFRTARDHENQMSQESTAADEEHIISTPFSEDDSKLNSNGGGMVQLHEDGAGKSWLEQSWRKQEVGGEEEKQFFTMKKSFLERRREAPAPGEGDGADVPADKKGAKALLGKYFAAKKGVPKVSVTDRVYISGAVSKPIDKDQAESTGAQQNPAWWFDVHQAGRVFAGFPMMNNRDHLPAFADITLEQGLQLPASKKHPLRVLVLTYNLAGKHLDKQDLNWLTEFSKAVAGGKVVKYDVILVTLQEVFDCGSATASVQAIVSGVDEKRTENRNILVKWLDGHMLIGQVHSRQWLTKRPGPLSVYAFGVKTVQDGHGNDKVSPYVAHDLKKVVLTDSGIGKSFTKHAVGLEIRGHGDDKDKKDIHILRFVGAHFSAEGTEKRTEAFKKVYKEFTKGQAQTVPLILAGDLNSRIVDEAATKLADGTWIREVLGPETHGQPLSPTDADLLDELGGWLQMNDDQQDKNVNEHLILADKKGDGNSHGYESESWKRVSDRITPDKSAQPPPSSTTMRLSQWPSFKWNAEVQKSETDGDGAGSA